MLPASVSIRFRAALGVLSCHLALATFAGDPEPAGSHGSAASALPEWKAMDYGPFLSATLEVSQGNIANKAIAIRLDPGDGGVARGHDFFLFETDTLRAAAGWSGPDFINWKNIAFDGTHEVHAAIVGQRIFSNPDAPGWADRAGDFKDARLTGRDGNRYGPLPRDWAHWRGLYVHGNQVILSYRVGPSEVLEMPGLERAGDTRILVRNFEIGPRPKPMLLRAAQEGLGEAALSNGQDTTDLPLAVLPPAVHRVPSRGGSGSTETVSQTVVALVGASDGLKWSVAEPGEVRLAVPAGATTLRFKLLYALAASDAELGQIRAAAHHSPPAPDLGALTHGGPAHWTEAVTTKVERLLDFRQPYVVESITLPVPNPYRSWMRLGGFDFFNDPSRAAVCTWQGDVWIVDGLGGNLSSFHWKRIASGLFQPLGLKIVDGKICVTCRDQITVLHDLNGDGETDFYENFNNDAQVTEHFHEFAMDLQTDSDGNFYYAKAGRHAKDALVPQHGTLLRVSKDGSKTEIVAYGFRAPNGVCVNNDGTYIVSDQEGHWTPENRIDWVKPGGFYGYMMGYHEAGRQPDNFEPPVVWIHKSLDRSPSEQLWVTSDRWGLPRGSLISLSYGTGKVLGVLMEDVGLVKQGGVYVLPIPAMPTGIIRGRFHPGDGQLYTVGLFGWASDKTTPGGFYRVRYTAKPLHVPIGLHTTRQGMLLTFNCPLDPTSAGDPENYAVSRWTYHRTANYGSDDYKISQKGQRGRDSVQVTAVKLMPDHRSVLLAIPDMQPCMQMEIKCNLQAEDGAKIAPLIENTILAVGTGAAARN
jgi:hypothetical protein